MLWNCGSGKKGGQKGAFSQRLDFFLVYKKTERAGYQELPTALPTMCVATSLVLDPILLYSVLVLALLLHLQAVDDELGGGVCGDDAPDAKREQRADGQPALRRDLLGGGVRDG